MDATNIVGFGPASAITSVIAAAVPDASIDLANVVSITDSTKIGLSWSPNYNGGSAILDYRINYAKSAELFTVLESGVTTPSYTTSVVLATGVYYKFTVESRNAVGYSFVSNQATIMVARIPDAPVVPTTTINNNNVEIRWITPFNGGSPILSYKVQIQTSDGTTYSEDAANCD